MTGTLPPDLPISTFVDGEVVNEVKWYNRFFKPINALRQALNPLEMVWVAYAGVATNIPNAAWTMVNVNTVVVDTLSLGIFSGGLSIPEDGVYECVSYCTFASSTGGNRRMTEVAVDGGVSGDPSFQISTQGSQTGNAGGTAAVPGATQLLPLQKGQRLQVAAWQDSTATLATGTTSTARPTLSVRRWA